MGSLGAYFPISHIFILIFFRKEFENIRKGYNFAAPKVKQAAFTDVLKC
jgi:hypothetical protein